MNTKKIITSFVAFTLTALPFAAFAQSGYTGPSLPSGNPSLDVTTLISTIMGYVWEIFAAIAVILFVYAGLLFLLANGSADKIKEARQAALWGVIGVIVMVLAFSIFALAKSITGLQ